MFKVAVGHSFAPDPLQAAQELWQHVAESLTPNLPCACVLFCGHPQLFAEALIDGLYGYCPDLQLAGCSSYAEASSRLGRYAEHSSTAMFFCSDTVHFDTALVPDVACVQQSDLRARVQIALDPLQATRPEEKIPKLCLVFTELMHVNQNALVQTLQAELGEEAMVLGGAAGHPTIIDLDNPTCQYHNRGCHHNSAVIMVFSGPLAVSTGVCLDGWYPLYERRFAAEMRPAGDGRHLAVTLIDGQPALDFYERAIGVDHLPDALREQIMICYPLIVYGEDPTSDGDYFDVFDKDRAGQSLIITDDVSPPCQVDIAVPIWEVVLNDVGNSVRRINEQFKGAWSAGALFMSCCSRSVAYQVQTSPSDELQVIISQCKPNLPVIGCYSYLEIGNRANRPESSRRESMTLVYVLLGEDWSAVQADIDSRDPVRMHQILTAVQSEHHFRPPVHPPQGVVKSPPQIVNHGTLVSPATSGCAKAELLLIEVGLVLRYLAALPRQAAGAVYVLSWLSDDERLVAKHVAQDVLRLGHPRLPRINTLERHLSQAIKHVKNSHDLKSTQRVYHATLMLGMVLLCLEDSGGRVPLDWVATDFSPQAVAETLYPKLQALRQVRYTQSQRFLAGALEEALKAAAQTDYEIDEGFRV